MPCYFPLQATFSNRSDGKKELKFSNTNARLFKTGVTPSGDNNLRLPCGRCMGCRLERSRQWAVRCLHESKCYEDNCFVTLTYSDDHLPPGGTLVRKHLQDFIMRLRSAIYPHKIRYFYCGEYGSKLSRPHYHICLFNYDFKDKKRLYKTRRGDILYESALLSKLWPFGMSSVGSFTFDSAAYVARYCTKKITGDQAEVHYDGKIPEFAGMSLKPGIGAKWFDKYAKTDLIPHNNIVVRGAKCKPPRYYDILWERKDPISFAKAKEERKELGEEIAFDNTAPRLAVKYKILQSKTKVLVRRFESGVDSV